MQGGHVQRSNESVCRRIARKLLESVFSGEWYEDGILQDATIIYEGPHRNI